jgi:molecular chaperone GrpE
LKPQLRWFSTSNDGSSTATKEGDASNAAEEGTNAPPTQEEATTAPDDLTEDELAEDFVEDDPMVEPEPAPASAALQNELRLMKDQLRRSLADQENTRTIARRDVQQAREFAIKGFAKSLLEVADNLQRALAAVPPEYRPTTNATTNETIETNEAEPHPMHTTFTKLYEGIAMTEQGLQRAFTQHGLRPFGQVGEPFDPSRHEALLDYDDPALPHHTVGMLMKCGYTLQDRVLRPAEVGVVVHKTPDTAAPENDNATPP